MRHAWTAFVVMVVAVVLMSLCAPIPIVGIFCYALLPAAGTVMVALGIGAIASRGQRRAVYYGAVIGTLALLTAAGLYLRQRAEVSGKADVHQRAKVARVVTAGLREPVSLEAERMLRYDQALFDAVAPACKDAHCFVIAGLRPKRIRVEEFPSEVLEGMGLKPAPPSEEARLSVRVTQASRGDRLQVRAEVIESGTPTATWDASLPAYDRPGDSTLPPWVHFWLEENPLVAMLKPRPRLGSHALGAFLRSAIRAAQPAGSAPRFEIDAIELHSQALAPPLTVDRKDPRYIGWWWADRDPRCEGVLSVEGRPGFADYYVTFLAAPQSGPQLRIGTESLICAGDAVYVHRYGRTKPDVLDLARYSLTGQHTADLRVRVPAQAFDTFIAFDKGAMTERDGTLGFDVRRVRFEWAKDAAGKPVRDADGSVENAIISRVGRYSATVPAAAAGTRDAIEAP